MRIGTVRFSFCRRINVVLFRVPIVLANNCLRINCLLLRYNNGIVMISLGRCVKLGVSERQITRVAQIRRPYNKNKKRKRKTTKNLSISHADDKKIQKSNDVKVSAALGALVDAKNWKRCDK